MSCHSCHASAVDFSSLRVAAWQWHLEYEESVAKIEWPTRPTIGRTNGELQSGTTQRSSTCAIPEDAAT